MKTSKEALQGWDFAASITGAAVASQAGASYVNAVEAAIHDLENSITNHQYRNLGIGQLQGYMFEDWSAGTFNVDAVAAGSADRAHVLRSTTKDSVDVLLDSGKTYSAKSYKTAAKSATAQAKFNADSGTGSYYGQEKLVPSDQLSDIKLAAHRQALRNQSIRPDIAESYAETERTLTDVIQNDEGVHSISASRSELDTIAAESKSQEFTASKHNVTLDSAIKPEYLVRQACKAGFSAAAVTVAIQLAPEIYKAIDYLIKHGELKPQQIKQLGEKGISAGAEGFLRGAISSSLLIMCEKGMLGEAFKGISPTLLGTTVAVVLQTVKNSILVSSGKMSAQQMGAAFVDTVIVSSGYLIGAHIGGIIGQALGFQLPVVGYLLGSLLGVSFCTVYNIGKKKVISFCVDTGFTCFGLVEQNYEMPEEVLHDMGIVTAVIARTQVERTDVKRVNIPAATVSATNYETINIKMLGRGLIGVNKVSYVLT